MNIRKKFGMILSEAIIQKRISRTELAEMLNVKYSTVCEWLKGTMIPSVEKIMKIERVLNISIYRKLEEKDMNKVVLVGRLTADPELRYTASNKAYTRFTIAVNRNFKNEDGESEADFISVVAWEKRAETICKYVKKGNRLGIAGKIQTGSYEKEDGSRGYLTDVIVTELEFLENKSKDDRPAPDYNEPEEEDPFADFGDSVELSDDDLPF